MTLLSWVLISMPVLVIFAGASAHFWIWKLRYVRHVPMSAVQFDEEEITLPQGVKLAEFRKRAEFGNKIVIAHYFRNLVEDIADKFRLLAVATVLAVVLTCIWTLDSHWESINSLPEADQWRRVSEIGITALQSRLSLATFTMMCVVVYFVRQEAAKFRSLLADCTKRCNPQSAK